VNAEKVLRTFFYVDKMKNMLKLYENAVLKELKKKRIKHQRFILVHP
jgi:hypothetical protein